MDLHDEWTEPNPFWWTEAKLASSYATLPRLCLYGMLGWLALASFLSARTFVNVSINAFLVAVNFIPGESLHLIPQDRAQAQSNLVMLCGFKKLRGMHTGIHTSLSATMTVLQL